MRRIFVDGPPRAGGRHTVRGEEHHYLTRVLRRRQGDLVEITDGAGRRFSATVVEVGEGEALLEAVAELEPAPSSWPLTLAVAVPKRQLMDDVVRKLSELGAMRLIPTIAARSTVRPHGGKVERWRRIAAESRRQCGRDVPLVVSSVTGFDAALEELEGGGAGLVLHNAARRGFPAAGTLGQGKPVGVLVGPEGGFTEGEIDRARGHGFAAVALGSTVLRVETAAIAAAVLGLAAMGAYEVGTSEK
jgi:16S rRNA (uracil1498-N3)-methyltransferase